MKKIILLIITTLFIISCDKEKDDDLNLISIDLITTDNPTFFAKTVILYEDNHFLIKTNLDTFIKSYPQEDYDEIKMQLIQDSNDKDVLLMTDYLKYPSDSTTILAYHLQNGSCLILDQKSNEIIPIIEMEEYMEGEPMGSRGGRRFYIKGDLFLEIVDFISVTLDHSK